MREAVGLFDQSSFAKFLVQGRDALSALDRACVSGLDVPVGRVVYTQLCNERGGIEADLTITRTGVQRFLVVTAAASQQHDLLHLERAIGDAAATVTDVTSGFAVLSLMGPRARAVLARLTPDDVGNAAFPFRTSREIEIGFARVRATRITYVGELGWELYVPSEYAPDVFDRLLRAGEPDGLRLCGYHALNSLRLEKAYRHWGHDIDSETTPLEAGLGFCIDWNKTEFLGRAALLAQRQAGVSRRLVQFRLDDPDAMLFHDEPVWRDGARVGRITSGMFGHTLGAAVGLGWVAGDGGDDGGLGPRRPLRDRDRRHTGAGHRLAASDVRSRRRALRGLTVWPRAFRPRAFRPRAFRPRAAQPLGRAPARRSRLPGARRRSAF